MEGDRLCLAFRDKRGIIWPRGWPLEPSLELLPDGGPIQISIPGFPGAVVEGKVVPGHLNSKTTVLELGRVMLGRLRRRIEHELVRQGLTTM